MNYLSKQQHVTQLSAADTSVKRENVVQVISPCKNDSKREIETIRVRLEELILTSISSSTKSCISRVASELTVDLLSLSVETRVLSPSQSCEVSVLNVVPRFFQILIHIENESVLSRKHKVVLLRSSIKINAMVKQLLNEPATTVEFVLDNIPVPIESLRI